MLSADPFAIQVAACAVLSVLVGAVILRTELAPWVCALFGVAIGALVGGALSPGRFLSALIGAAFCGLACYLYQQSPFAKPIRDLLKVGAWRSDGSIAIQAAAGAAFASLFAMRQFREAALDAMTFRGVVFILIGTALSTILIVPLHRAIMGDDAASQHQESDARKSRP